MNQTLTKTGIYFAVIRTAAKYFKVSIQSIMDTEVGNREVQKARTLAILFTRQYCKDFTVYDIGNLFSRDYSSVLAACKSANDRLVRDREFKKAHAQVDKLIKEVTY